MHQDPDLKNWRGWSFHQICALSNEHTAQAELSRWQEN